MGKYIRHLAMKMVFIRWEKHLQEVEARGILPQSAASNFLSKAIHIVANSYLPEESEMAYIMVLAIIKAKGDAEVLAGLERHLRQAEKSIFESLKEDGPRLM